uniref:Uncharacterized protein n=1 Tax=Oryzias melastigma TaxID=30732 RepID=A0A3B3CGG1_ORYME
MKKQLLFHLLLEGEAFHFVPFPVYDFDLPDENFTWYKNNSEVKNITTEEENSIHYHGGALFFLNISSADAGHYTDWTYHITIYAIVTNFFFHSFSLIGYDYDFVLKE